MDLPADKGDVTVVTILVDYKKKRKQICWKMVPTKVYLIILKALQITYKEL